MSELQEVALDDKIELSNNVNNVAPTTETIEQVEETVFVPDGKIGKKWIFTVNVIERR